MAVPPWSAKPPQVEGSGPGPLASVWLRATITYARVMAYRVRSPDRPWPARAVSYARASSAAQGCNPCFEVLPSDERRRDVGGDVDFAVAPGTWSWCTARKDGADGERWRLPAAVRATTKPPVRGSFRRRSRHRSSPHQPTGPFRLKGSRGSALRRARRPSRGTREAGCSRAPLELGAAAAAALGQAIEPGLVPHRTPIAAISQHAIHLLPDVCSSRADERVKADDSSPHRED